MCIRDRLNATGDSVVESYVAIAKQEAQAAAKASGGGMAAIREAVETVSYTHLDVYKRQVSARMPEGMRPIREELGIHAPMVCYSGGLVLGPVSYTHLDVYKRQHV